MMVGDKRTSKTVFVLGAGFSRGAGFPLQAEILDRVRDLAMLDVYVLAEQQRLPSAAADAFREDHEKILEFLRKTFTPDLESRPDISSLDTPSTVYQTPPLEDVFTLLDQAAAERFALPTYSVRELQEIRASFDRVVLFPFHHSAMSITGKSQDFYRRIAAYVLERRISAGQQKQAIAFVSLNWDSMLEESISWCTREIARPDRIDVDYGCFTAKLTESGTHTPSQQQQARGIFNVKVAKLHGSANWLICPLCNTLFTGLGADESPWELYVQPRECPACAERWPNAYSTETPKLPGLEPFFITPTFVKVFDNPHIQMTWHTAYVELAEATEVVFIGYSLPDADYHVRTLLRRAIRPEARIKVVLTESDEKKRNTPKHLRRHLPAERYRSFFGPERPTFILSGVEGYFTQLMGRTSLTRRLDEIRKLLEN